MNSTNSTPSKPHGLLISLSDKINLKTSDEYVPLSSLRIYHTWKNIKKSYKNNKLEISPPIRNGEFELPDWSYSV